MDVKQAVAHAKGYIVELFEAEGPTNIGLEEVELDNKNNEWIVTIGFSRPWDEPRTAFAAMAAASSGPKRSYKTVRISNRNDQVLSIKTRELKN